MGVGRALGASDFCSSVAGRSLTESSIDERSDGEDLTGKRGLNRARSRSSGAVGGAVAVSWSVGCRAELISAASIPAVAGISKSGASFFTTDVLTASANALSGRAHEPR